MFNWLLLFILLTTITWAIWLARIHWVSPAEDRVLFNAELDNWPVVLVGFERDGVRSGRTAAVWVSGHAQLFFGSGYYRTYVATIAVPDGFTLQCNVAVEAKLTGGRRAVRWAGLSREADGG